MTQVRPRPQELTASNVRVVTPDEAREEARRILDDYERRYGVASERLAEAFTDESGRVQETGAYLQWRTMLERWRALTTVPPAI